MTGNANGPPENITTSGESPRTESAIPAVNLRKAKHPRVRAPGPAALGSAGALPELRRAG